MQNQEDPNPYATPAARGARESRSELPRRRPCPEKFWHHEVSVLSLKPTAEPPTVYILSIKYQSISGGRCGGRGQNDRSKTYGKRHVFASPPEWAVGGTCTNLVTAV